MRTTLVILLALSCGCLTSAYAQSSLSPPDCPAGYKCVPDDEPKFGVPVLKNNSTLRRECVNRVIAQSGLDAAEAVEAYRDPRAAMLATPTPEMLDSICGPEN